MQKTNHAKFIILMLFIPFILNGCYDRFEVDDLAYVIAIGADVGENDQIDITYQIAVPLKITGENSETGKETYTTYTVTAPSLSIGNNKINTQISKEVNLSHVKIIVYSEELARQDISGHMNVFLSQSDIRPKANFLVCKGRAQDLLEKVSPKLEESPARYYELLFNSSNYTGDTANSELVHFYTSAQSIDRNGFGTYIKLSEESGEESELTQDGLAVFKGSKMVGILDTSHVISHLILTNNLKRTGFAVPDFKEKNNVISVHLVQRDTPSIKVNTDENYPQIKIEIKLEAHLFSSGSAIDFHDSDNVKKLESELNNALKKNIEEYLEITTHKFESDIAGFGRYARINFLTWKEFESYKWLEKYKEATYDVSVETKVNISQIISHKIPNTEM